MPLNSIIQNETLNFIKRSGLISYFVFEELDRDRGSYKGIGKQDFVTNFEVSDDLVSRFQDYINVKENAKVTFVAYNLEMKLLIKAALADQLYGSNASEEIYNTSDDMIKEVIKLSIKE